MKEESSRWADFRTRPRSEPGSRDTAGTSLRAAMGAETAPVAVRRARAPARNEDDRAATRTGAIGPTGATAASATPGESRCGQDAQDARNPDATGSSLQRPEWCIVRASGELVHARLSATGQRVQRASRWCRQVGSRVRRTGTPAETCGPGPGVQLPTGASGPGAQECGVDGFGGYRK